MFDDEDLELEVEAPAADCELEAAPAADRWSCNCACRETRELLRCDEVKQAPGGGRLVGVARPQQTAPRSTLQHHAGERPFKGVVS